jgi:hypothetical protein
VLGRGEARSKEGSYTSPEKRKQESHTFLSRGHNRRPVRSNRDSLLVSAVTGARRQTKLAYLVLIKTAAEEIFRWWTLELKSDVATNSEVNCLQSRSTHANMYHQRSVGHQLFVSFANRSRTAVRHVRTCMEVVKAWAAGPGREYPIQPRISAPANSPNGLPPTFAFSLIAVRHQVDYHTNSDAHPVRCRRRPCRCI